MMEFATPGNARYVADPARRQEAIALSQQRSALAQADANQHIAQLRRKLTDPQQRTAIAAQVGQAELTRLSSLSDDQLEEEVINSSVQHVEQTLFVPKAESAQYAHPADQLRVAPDAQEMAAGERLLQQTIPDGGVSNPQYPNLLKVVPNVNFRRLPGSGSAGNPSDQTTNIDLGTYIYLTGFTLGHDYEWKMEVDTTINWCVVGCSSTYDVQLYAGFNYGFGLRFPIQTQLQYHNIVHPNQTADATLTATFKPIDGTADQFASTGLESDQIFGGKELVAQVGANAGFNYNLPVVGSGGTGFQVGVDFTQWLPAPYTNGTFTPPVPGTHGIDTPYLDTIDLLGGLLNFGALGGQVFPAVDINLHSNKLQFTLHDEVLNKQVNVTSTGQTVSLGVDKTRKNDSHFSFGNPVYNLGFTLTPGIDARLFIDVAVWSDSWIGRSGFRSWPSTCRRTESTSDAMPAPPVSSTSGPNMKQESPAGSCRDCERRLRPAGNTMTWKAPAFQTCQNAVASHELLGVQSCVAGGMLPKLWIRPIAR